MRPPIGKLDDTQDRYTPDAGIVTGPVCCGVCGDVMECLAKDSRGPRGYVQAMGMRLRGETDTGSPHDIFSCPNREKNWHRQVVALRKAARKTVSGRMEKELLDEAKQVLETRTETKIVSMWDI